MNMASKSPMRALSLRLAALTLLPPALPAIPGDLLWSFDTGAVIFGAPAIGPAGEVVFAAEDARVYSCNPDGSLRWVFDGVTDWIDSSPTIAADGTVYVGSWDNFLYALDLETGALKWRFETGSMVLGSAAVGPDGRVYFGSDDGFLYCLAPDGSLVWGVEPGTQYGPIHSSPVLSHSGDTVYFGNDVGQFFALATATGSRRWMFDLRSAHAITGAAAIANDGSIYFGSKNGYLYALRPTGALDWRFPAGLDPGTEGIRSAPVLGSDGTVYFAAQDGYLYAVDALGFQLWEAFVGDVFYCTPAIDAAGNLIIAGYAGYLAPNVSHALSFNPAGELLWQFVFEGYNDSSPNIAPDGSITFGSHAGLLYKLAGAAPLPQTGWPRFQAGRRQAGFAADLARTELVDLFPWITVSRAGWAQVPWFGRGWVTGLQLPWTWHLGHGFMRAVNPGPQAVTFFSPALDDWLTAPAAAQGWVYRFSTETWLPPQ